MKSCEQIESLQHRTLAAYLAMTTRHRNWAGRLVMLSASADAAPLALATQAAGGATLWVCTPTASLRDDAAAGIVDFQVGDLGEALRILKNEIRKGNPVSVGVLHKRDAIWKEAVERGLQPDALLAEPGSHHWTATLVQRGAEQLVPPSDVQSLTNAAPNWRERKAADEQLLAAADLLDEWERERAMRWLRAAPRLFPRDLCRNYAAAWEASNEVR